MHRLRKPYAITTGSLRRRGKPWRIFKQKQWSWREEGKMRAPNSLEPRTVWWPRGSRHQPSLEMDIDEPDAHVQEAAATLARARIQSAGKRRKTNSSECDASARPQAELDKAMDDAGSSISCLFSKHLRLGTAGRRVLVAFRWWHSRSTLGVPTASINQMRCGSRLVSAVLQQQPSNLRIPPRAREAVQA